MLPPQELLDRLTTEVREFRCAHFVLQNDLSKLIQLRQVQTPEAAIFYCSRILEALAINALDRLGMTPSVKVYSNLELLRQLDLFSPSVFQWAHALRRLGNEVRHLHCPIEVEDAVLACVLLERWLEWFFCSFPQGPRVASLTRDGHGLALTSNSQLPRLLQEIETPNFDPRSLVPHIKTNTGLFALRCPGLFSLVAEMLLDRQEHEFAEAILILAIARFPKDMRLLQLRGLLYSHRGDLREALECLEPLLTRSPDDSETGSILAGVLKRMWWADTTATKALGRSHEIYRKAWERSRKKDAYLGTNAATTALWLSNATRSRQLAEAVCQCLRERDVVLTRLSPQRNPFADYWGMVSLAEAEVLLGFYDKARARYLKIFAQHHERKQNIRGTKKQLEIILGVLIRSNDVDAFLSSAHT